MFGSSIFYDKIHRSLVVLVKKKFVVRIYPTRANIEIATQLFVQRSRNSGRIERTVSKPILHDHGLVQVGNYRVSKRKNYKVIQLASDCYLNLRNFYSFRAVNTKIYNTSENVFPSSYNA